MFRGSFTRLPGPQVNVIRCRDGAAGKDTVTHRRASIVVMGFAIVRSQQWTRTALTSRQHLVR